MAARIYWLPFPGCWQVELDDGTTRMFRDRAEADAFRDGDCPTCFGTTAEHWEDCPTLPDPLTQHHKEHTA